MGDNEIPVNPLANSFIYQTHLNSSFSTKTRVAYELNLTLEYFESIKIDINARVANGLYLTNQEISNFYDIMRLRKEFFDYKEKISVIPSIESKSMRNTIATNLYRKNKVAKETATGRVRTLREYIEYLHEHYHGDRIQPKDLEVVYKKNCSKLKSYEGYGATPNSVVNSGLEDSVIPKEKYNKLLEIIKPCSPHNPFTSAKLRNYLICKILIDTGIRRSEVCKMKISDCLFHGDANKIWIYSNPDDPYDPRLNKPNKKAGQNHLSGLRPTLMSDLYFYIKHVRNNFPHAHTHDFVFVAEKNSRGTAGSPLVREMVNYIISKVSNAIDYNFHPHLLRHKWNENLTDSGIEKGIDHGYLEDMRRSSMGWGAESRMGDIYNDKKLQAETIKIMNEHQERVDGKKV
ncbi:site-specific integrase [Psychrosphaera aquimarina]|uniref:Site-specific integrase n=1 Tax=Psychrosphaera aquimarina TaxID=2044854 RepID=A0ABU3QWF1_9GAMM|nr:site-specific integrase [Psychrosphaera aquimarina]MDU0111754.1 site-specific integrase [Psychrosphaera aquimarina]